MWFALGTSFSFTQSSNFFSAVSTRKLISNSLVHGTKNLVAGLIVGVGVGVGVGAIEEVGEGVGVGLGEEVGFVVGIADLIMTPLYQTNFFPCLVQVYFPIANFCNADLRTGSPRLHNAKSG